MPSLCCVLRRDLIRAVMAVGPDIFVRQGQFYCAGTESGQVPLQHEACVKVHQLLRDQLAAPAAADAWKQRCSQKFAWSSYFGGAKRLPLEQPVEKAAESPAAANGLANGVDGLKLA